MKLQAGSFFGTINQTLEKENYLLTESYHSPQSKIPYHSHDKPYFSLILQGRIAEENFLCNYIRKPGTLVYHPAGYEHSNKVIDDHSEVFNLQLGKNLEGQLSNQFSKTQFKYIFDEKIISRTRKLYIMFLSKKSNKIDSEIQSLVECLKSSKHVRLNLQFPDWFTEILQYMELHYDGMMTLEILSDIVNKHPAHISRSFNKYLRCSLSDYIHKVRIEKACQRLRTSTVLLSKLAHQLGYSDHSHFTHTFVRLVGITPSDYRDLFSSFS